MLVQKDFADAGTERRVKVAARALESRAAEPWVSVDVVAIHLGVAKDCVYRWIVGKGLPAHRIGMLWKCKLTEVDAWVRTRGTDESVPRAKLVQKRKTKRTR